MWCVLMWVGCISQPYNHLMLEVEVLQSQLYLEWYIRAWVSVLVSQGVPYGCDVTAAGVVYTCMSVCIGVTGTTVWMWCYCIRYLNDSKNHLRAVTNPFNNASRLHHLSTSINIKEIGLCRIFLPERGRHHMFPRECLIFLGCLRFGLFGYFAKWFSSGTVSKWCLCRGLSLHKDQLLQDPLTFKYSIFSFFFILLVVHPHHDYPVTTVLTHTSLLWHDIAVLCWKCH